jgi:hypothetical protein
VHLIAAFFRGGRGGGGFFLLLPFALMIVFPRETLEWVARKTGKSFHVRHLVWVQAIGIVGMILISVLLDYYSPRFRWIEPPMAVGAVALVRLLRAIVADVLGFKD